MKTRLPALAALCFTLFPMVPALAWEALPAKNEATLARNFALPALGQSQILAPDEQNFQINLDVITEYYADSNASESIVLDGETTKIGLAYRKGFATDLELTVEVPVLIVGGGFMDGFIQDWHRAFSLPNGGRENAPNDRRLYQYSRNGVTLLNETHSSTSLGDTQIGAGWQLNDQLALRGLIKLPTGDSDRLAGGALGTALWADWALPFGQNSAFDGFASGGLSLNRRVNALASQQKAIAAFGGAGLGYHLTDNLQVLGQLYMHSALYKDSNLDGLRHPGLQLTLGGSYRISSRHTLNLYFQEDPITSSSPDFSIHIGLTVR